LPPNQVSATDYYAVALALQQSRDFSEAIAGFKSALAVASLLDDEVASLRALGALEMMTGKTGEAHSHFQQALDLFGTKYPGYDNFTKNSTNFITEMNWAVSEASASDKEAAAQHLNKTEQLIRAMPPGDQNGSV
jgi:tetratricopeptide (TPR) repeat protein